LARLVPVLRRQVPDSGLRWSFGHCHAQWSQDRPGTAFLLDSIARPDRSVTLSPAVCGQCFT
jgi:hypothetical protein